MRLKTAEEIRQLQRTSMVDRKVSQILKGVEQIALTSHSCEYTISGDFSENVLDRLKELGFDVSRTYLDIFPAIRVTW